MQASYTLVGVEKRDSQIILTPNRLVGTELGETTVRQIDLLTQSSPTVASTYQGRSQVIAPK